MNDEKIKTTKKKNWFPGHMKKSGFLMSENLKNVDLIYELIDARAAVATRNSSILRIIKNKLRIVILGKKDLAEDFVTRLWVEKIKTEEKVFAIAVNCREIKQTKEIIKISQQIIKEHQEKIGKKNIIKNKFRAMVVGVPNVGKSTLINSLAKKKKVKTGNFPGVTLSEQWVSIGENISLLDMPGKLNFENVEENEFFLELIGAIKNGEFDEEEVACFLLDFLKENKKEVLNKIFDSDVNKPSYVLLEEYAKKKFMFLKNAEVDFKRASEFLIKEFREAKLGKISLQKS